MRTFAVIINITMIVIWGVFSLRFSSFQLSDSQYFFVTLVVYSALIIFLLNLILVLMGKNLNVVILFNALFVITIISLSVYAAFTKTDVILGKLLIGIILLLSPNILNIFIAKKIRIVNGR